MILRTCGGSGRPARYANHDCSPNAARFDYFDDTAEAKMPRTGDNELWGTRVELRAMEALDAGSEVRISYTGALRFAAVDLCHACQRWGLPPASVCTRSTADGAPTQTLRSRPHRFSRARVCTHPRAGIAMPRWHRQKRLRDEYGFVCACRRCFLEGLVPEDDQDGDAFEDVDSDADGEEAEDSDADGEEAKAVDKTAAQVCSEATQKSKEAVLKSGGTSKGKEKALQEDEDEGGGGREERDEDDEGGLGEETELQLDELELFKAKFTCPDDGCGGTLAPLATHWLMSKQDDSATDQDALIMECNRCSTRTVGMDHVVRKFGSGGFA